MKEIVFRRLTSMRFLANWFSFGLSAISASILLAQQYGLPVEGTMIGLFVILFFVGIIADKLNLRRLVNVAEREADPPLLEILERLKAIQSSQKKESEK